MVGNEARLSRSTLFSLLVLALLCIVCLPLFVSHVERSPVPLKAGELALPAGYQLTKPIKLDGDWSFQWLNAKRPARALRIPGNWTEHAPDLPESGRARYDLTIRNFPPGIHRLYIPTIYCANAVSVNGEILARRGTIGNIAAETSYFWRASDVTFASSGGDLKLSIELACFHHRDNGIEAIPVIGPPEAMQEMFTLRWSQEMLFQVSLMLLGLYGVVVWIYRRSDIASLYLGLACFAFSPVTAMLGFDNMLLLAFPGFSFPVMLAFVYLITGLAQLFFLSYAHALFPGESPRRGYLAVCAMVILFFGAQGVAFLVAGTLAASQINSWLSVELLIYFPYILFVLARAARRGREGAIPFLVGIAGLFVASLLMSIVSAGYLPSDRAQGFNYTTYGILMLLFSHLVVLADRWTRSINTTERSNADLRQLLEVNSSITSEMELNSLLGQVVAATTRIVRAERSSLFLHDPKTDELWSLVAEGVEQKVLRFPADTGLAGQSFMNGTTLIVDNAYAHPSFNPAFDQQTGFVTRNAISMPITTNKGKKLGVIQVLNRRDAPHFTQDDAERMRAFASQAAIALDNASLFGEIVDARNANDAILQSMSSGVMTLNRKGKLLKLNNACCRIMEVDPQDSASVDWWAFAERNNDWIGPLLSQAQRSRAATVHLDIPITTVAGNVISANLSVVPLIGKARSDGWLIIIEDISEGKRLQGAMRRFMPQQVVDQVLKRGDDLMFGSACKASVLFADIRGFTSLSESLTPRQTVDMLNEVFTELFEAVSANDGIVDKYIGDAVMAVFGVPFASDNDPANAVRGAISMLKALSGINELVNAADRLPLQLGIGISTGDVVAGTIGSPKRMDYTVIGDSVNLASRLQELTKTYGLGIIVCETTAASLPADISCRMLDLIRVRGRQTPVRIFEVLVPGRFNAKALVCYDQGMVQLSARDWSGAEASFRKACQLDPDDIAARLMLDRARHACASPPSADWDGVW